MIETLEKPYYSGLGERVDWDDIQVAGQRGAPINTHQIEFDSTIDVGGQSIVNRAEEKYSPIVAPMPEGLTIQQMYDKISPTVTQPYEIVLKPGTYELSATITPKPNTILRGSGMGVTIIKGGTVYNNLITINAAGTYQFADLTLEMSVAGGPFFERAVDGSMWVSCDRVNFAHTHTDAGHIGHIIGGTNNALNTFEFWHCAIGSTQDPANQYMYLTDTTDGFSGYAYFKDCFFRQGKIRGEFAQTAGTIHFESCYCAEAESSMGISLKSTGGRIIVDNCSLGQNAHPNTDASVLDVGAAGTIEAYNSRIWHDTNGVGESAARTTGATGSLTAYDCFFSSKADGVSCAGATVTLIGGAVSAGAGWKDLKQSAGTLNTAYVRYTTSSGTITNLITLSTTNFGATTSAQLLAVLSDETGTGLAVFNDSPTFITPVLGAAQCTSINAVVPAALAIGFNISGGTAIRTLTVDETVSISGKQNVTVNLTSLAGLTYASLSFVKMTAAGTFALDTTVYASNPMTTLGDTTYGGASGVPTRLAGSTSNLRRFYIEQAVAGVAQAPAWDAIVQADISDTVTVAKGGTGAATFGANQLLYGNTTSAILSSANLTYDGTTFDVNNSFFHTTFNTATRPASLAGGGLSLSWNYAGGAAEVDLWNVYSNATTAFSFKQKTGADSHTDLMNISGAGAVRIHNLAHAGPGTRNVVVDVNGVLSAP